MRVSAPSIAILAFLISVPVGVYAAQPKIGVASAVKNQVESLAGASARPLSVGSDIFTNERIRTGDAATAQLLFLDKTVVSVGPKAELTLDRFVYDPDRGSGRVVLDTLRGSFRFATGSQNPNNYTIKTPVATLGIRGTLIDLLVQDGRTVILLVEGAVNIRLINGQILEHTRPGTAFVINANGTYSGPVTWDGTIVNALGDISFPLYGWSFSGDPKFNTVPLGGGIQSIDNLNALGAAGGLGQPGSSRGGGNIGSGNSLSVGPGGQ
jgi:hypothetical protein